MADSAIAIIGAPLDLGAGSRGVDMVRVRSGTRGWMSVWRCSASIGGRATSKSRWPRRREEDPRARFLRRSRRPASSSERVGAGAGRGASRHLARRRSLDRARHRRRGGAALTAPPACCGSTPMATSTRPRLHPAATSTACRSRLFSASACGLRDMDGAGAEPESCRGDRPRASTPANAPSSARRLPPYTMTDSTDAACSPSWSEALDFVAGARACSVARHGRARSRARPASARRCAAASPTARRTWRWSWSPSRAWSAWIMVEVNPILDHHNATAELAVELAASAFGARIL